MATENKKEMENKFPLEEVLKIIQVAGENEISEVEIESGSFKLSLKKNSSETITQGNYVSPVLRPDITLPKTKSADSPSQKEIPVAEKTENQGEETHKILSPMAGTLYLAPSPNSPPYVKVGEKVSAGQPVCIVEAMKLMNEIKADKSGKLVKILVENAKPVEKGTPLFLIDLKG